MLTSHTHAPARLSLIYTVRYYPLVYVGVSPARERLYRLAKLELPESIDWRVATRSGHCANRNRH